MGKKKKSRLVCAKYYSWKDADKGSGQWPAGSGQGDAARLGQLPNPETACQGQL